MSDMGVLSLAQLGLGGLSRPHGLELVDEPAGADKVVHPPLGVGVFPVPARLHPFVVGLRSTCTSTESSHGRNASEVRYLLI